MATALRPRPPADEGRKFTWSLTMGATSDYIFRGISLSDEDPAFQPWVNFSYGISIFRPLGLATSPVDGFSPWEHRRSTPASSRF